MEQFQGKFKSVLFQLDFSIEDIETSLSGDTFVYRKQLRPEHQGQRCEYELCVKYFYISAENLEQTLFEKHADIWNENNEYVFIAISEQITYLINAKVKPNPDSPMQRSNIIESFAYGVNSELFAPEELARLKDRLGKESIDSAYFFDFIVENTRQQKTTTVDKDLLLNLIQLRNDLLDIRDAQETIHLLILRCLFIKYLEDREIYEKDYLLNILKTASSQKLVDAFEQIKRINGDIFKYDEFSVNDIDRAYLEKLAQFFSSFDYRNGQGHLFPYKFDKIPIQLISHVYEAFLSNARKGNKGIYYTPTFVVKFMLAHTVQPKLSEKKKLTVLDPACGSGAFLVEAFKEIVKANQAEYDYERKVSILKNQIWGIDIDKQALQIATFSLYLALLEGEKPEAIREKIRKKYPNSVKGLRENDIRNKFTHHFKHHNSLLKEYINNCTIMLTKENEACTRDETQRTDIELFVSWYGKFVVECKRLNSAETRYIHARTDKEGAYNVDGMEKFIELIYSEGDEYAGMIGFIIKGNAAKIANKLKLKIEDFHPSCVITSLLEQKCADWELSFQSKHIRTNNEAIHFYHIFFDFVSM